MGPTSVHQQAAFRQGSAIGSLPCFVVPAAPRKFDMLFCEKVRTGKLVPPAEAASANRLPAGGHAPDPAHGGRIRPGGSPLPLQDKPMVRDQPRHRIPSKE